MRLLFKWGEVNITCAVKKFPAFILAEQTVALMITSLVVISLITFWGGVQIVKERLNDQIISARLLKEATDRYHDTQVPQHYQIDGYQVQVTKQAMQVRKQDHILIRVVRQ